MPRHHPGMEWLASYAAGDLAEGFAAMIAAHLVLCPTCRNQAEMLEAVGGAVLDELEDAALPAGGAEAIFARTDALPAPAPHETSSLLPWPIQSYLATPFERVKWRRIGPRVELCKIRRERADGYSQLLLVHADPGGALALHDHEGPELSLVLAGGYTDETGNYLRGDMAAMSPGRQHKPVADAGDKCLTLIMTDAPIRLEGPLGRLINPLIDF